jgi:flagellar basal body-associated protein FliL
MEKNSKSLDTDSGFELDKIDPEQLHGDQVEKPVTATAARRPLAGRKPSALPRSIPRKVTLALMVASIVLVVGTALLLIYADKIHLDLPFFKSDIHKKPDTYVSVGPVILSVDSGDLIKLTLDINCSKKSYCKTVSSLDSQIRSRAIWALQTPKAAKLLQSNDYVGLRRYLATRIMEIFPKGMVTEIYFSQFLRY